MASIARNGQPIEILLTGGNNVSRHTMQVKLEEHGYRVISRHRMKDILGICQEQAPDIVIVDTRLDYHHGAELCSTLRHQPGCEHVLMLAVIPNDPEALKVVLAAGADDCLIDPVQHLLLLRRLEILLRSRSQHSASLYTDISTDSERKYRHLFDAANDAIFIVDLREDAILDVNRRVTKWLGYTRDEVLRMPYSSLEVRGDFYPDENIIGQETSESGHFVFEQLYRHRDGRVIPAEVSSCLLMYDGRRTVLNFVRDLSQRKEIEAAEVEQRRLAETLAQTAADLNSTLRVDEVVDRVLTSVTQIIPGEAANIMLIRGSEAFIEAHCGYEEIGVEGTWVERVWDITAPFNLSWVIENRRPSVVNDTLQSSKWLELGDTVWIRSSVCAPIMIKNTVIGVINVDHRRPNQFLDVHGEYLLAFANQAGIAIQNARLHEAAQHHVDVLAARVEQRTAELSEMNRNLQQQIEERHQVEHALAEERNLLRTLIDNIPDEIYVKDLEGRLILANQALINRIQHRAPNQQVLGSTSFDYVPAEEAQMRTVQERVLMQTRRAVFNDSWVVPGRHGDPVNMLTTKVPLQDHQGDVIGLIGINRNVTDLKNAEEQLNLVIRSANCLLWSAVVEDHGLESMTWKMEISNELAAQDFLPLSLESDRRYIDAWRLAILPEDRITMYERSREALQSGATSYQQEFRVRRIDGVIRWLHEAVTVTSLQRGRYSLVGVATDITERKQAEQTLQRANEILEQRVAERTTELTRANEVLRREIVERQRAELAEREQRLLAEALTGVAALLNNSLDLDEVLDRVLMFVERVVPSHETSNIILIEDDTNVRAIRIHNAPDRPDGADDSKMMDCFPMDSLSSLRYIIETGQPLAIPDTRNAPNWTKVEGREWIRSYIGVPIQIDGRVIGFLNFASQTPYQFHEKHARRLLAFSDQMGIAIRNAQLFQAVQQYAAELSDRVAERTLELEYERSQLRAILDAMTEGVIYFDSTGQVRYVNQSLAQLTDYRQEQWLESEGTQLLFSMLDDPSEELIKVQQERVQRNGIWRHRVKLRRKNGEIFDASLVVTRVNTPDERPAGGVVVVRDISTEKRLEEQKARFIATASHELRTPITNMKTRLYLIRRQPGHLDHHLEVMDSVTDRMRKLVDDLLDVSRFEHGVITLERETFELQDVIRKVFDIQFPEAQIKSQKMTLEMESTPLQIYADRSRIMQVVTNLVTNAINYTREGGRIEVHVSRMDYGVGRGCALIQVKDNGIGIPLELHSEVFKPFFRANDYTSGVGLGLSITKEIVELHQGEIVLADQPPPGATFIVRLPLVD